jgi:hypothetical protein
MRRREQDRLARMEYDYQKRTEEQDFLVRREERMRASEERTAKKRAKRLKKKESKRQKKQEKVGAVDDGEVQPSAQQGPGIQEGPQDQHDESSDESDDDKYRGRPPLPNRVTADPSIVPHTYVRKS